LIDKKNEQYISRKQCARSTRRINSNHAYDGYKRLSAAVIIGACIDWKNPKGNSHDSIEAQNEQKRKKREKAKRFLEGDLQPWANMLGLESKEDHAFNQWLKDSGLQGKLEDEFI